VAESVLSHESPLDPTTGGASHAARIDSLFRAHNEALVRFLSSRLRSRQEAMEVAQEAYVRMLNLADPGAVSFLRAFLFRTAANIAVDRLRHGGHERRLRESPMFREFVETRTPERHAIGVQDVAALRRLVGELPEKCRYAFLMYRVSGVELPEIARQMQVSERMVRLYVQRALEHCRTGLETVRSSERRASEEHGNG
jgi:RNA polymerase sigma-70 factor (ECF subfamily)